MIFCREVQYDTDSDIQMSAYKGNNMFPNEIMKLQL
jgi:hypothetical protein